LLPDNGNGVRHAGNIFLDGQPLSSLKLKDVHRHIAIVSQVRTAFAVARAASDGPS
jgi:ABC-type multidrug transport system fused ATPase/permease subunit